MMRGLIKVAISVLFFANPSAAIQKEIISAAQRDPKNKDALVTIDEVGGVSHHESLVAAHVHRHQNMSSPLAAALSESSDEDPCRYLGCNSHKCEWVGGEVVRKVETKKACKNAKALTSRAKGKIDTLT